MSLTHEQIKCFNIFVLFSPILNLKKLLVMKNLGKVSKFGGNYGMSLEGDCHEVEVISNLELLVTFGMSSEGV